MKPITIEGLIPFRSTSFLPGCQLAVCKGIRRNGYSKSGRVFVKTNGRTFHLGNDVRVEVLTDDEIAAYAKLAGKNAASLMRHKKARWEECSTDKLQDSINAAVKLLEAHGYTAYKGKRK